MLNLRLLIKLSTEYHDVNDNEVEFYGEIVTLKGGRAKSKCRSWSQAANRNIWQLISLQVFLNVFRRLLQNFPSFSCYA